MQLEIAIGWGSAPEQFFVKNYQSSSVIQVQPSEHLRRAADIWPAGERYDALRRRTSKVSRFKN
jgi:hypothetical protein